MCKSLSHIFLPPFQSFRHRKGHIFKGASPLPFFLLPIFSSPMRNGPMHTSFAPEQLLAFPNTYAMALADEGDTVFRSMRKMDSLAVPSDRASAMR